MNSTDYTPLPLPEVYCPFPEDFTTGPHPHGKAAERAIFDVFNSTGDPFLCDLAARGPALPLATHGASLFLGTSPPALRAGLMHLSFLDTIDDWAEGLYERGDAESFTSARETLLAFLGRARQILQGAPLTAADSPMTKFCYHWLQAFIDLDPQWDRRRMNSFMWRYLQSQLWDLDLARLKSAPPLEVFIPYRIDSSALESINEMLLPLYGLQVPSPVLEHPAVRRLRQATACWCAWLNDVFGANVELQANVVSVGLVMVLQRELGCGWHTAQDAAVDLMHKEMTTYLDVKKRLPQLGVIVDDHLARYMHQLETMMANYLVLHTIDPHINGITHET
ncbi:terpene synthase family protein [Streptomyces sp. NPDC001407]|uniref:terpene synthase family protein n=1 Tax=Streptomyces sp. NPDC001407 TaxID=3364573 RepID=UPI0036925D6A